MDETATQDPSICLEVLPNHMTECGQKPERFSAALRAMMMSDAMGAYDLLEH